MSPSPLEVIHIGPCHLEIPAKRGGAVERRMWELAQAQQRCGAKVRVFSVGEVDADESLNGVLISRVRVQAHPRLKMVAFLRKCSERIQTGNAVLHFHNSPEGSWVFRDHANPKVLTFDFPRFRRGRQTPLFFFYRYCLKKFDLLMPVSEFCKSSAAKYWALPKERFRVVYNGVNLAQFRPEPSLRHAFRASYGFSDNTLLVYVGRVNEQKGTDLLVNCYRVLRKEYPNLRLAIAGPPGQFGHSGETDLTRQIKEVGGLYLGAVEESQLAKLFNAADIFILPTRQDEMFGMVAAEAQACGAPVVCSDNGGLPEVVSPQSGELFRAGSAEALIESVRGLLEDPNRLARYGEQARPNAARFSWDCIARDFQTSYRIALGEPSESCAAAV